MGNKIDEAFNWLVLMISIVSGVLIDLGETIEVKKLVAFGIVPPLLALIVIWLFSHFTERVTPLVILKSFAWFFSAFLFFTFIFFFIYITTPFGKGPAWLTPPLAFVSWGMVFTVIIATYVFYAVAIQPVYRKMYEDSRFLTSRLQSVGLYVVAFVTYLFIMLPFAGDILKALL